VSWRKSGTWRKHVLQRGDLTRGIADGMLPPALVIPSDLFSAYSGTDRIGAQADIRSGLGRSSWSTPTLF
jgi:hypothetical protein